MRATHKTAFFCITAICKHLEEYWGILYFFQRHGTKLLQYYISTVRPVVRHIYKAVTHAGASPSRWPIDSLFFILEISTKIFPQLSHNPDHFYLLIPYFHTWVDRGIKFFTEVPVFTKIHFFRNMPRLVFFSIGLNSTFPSIALVLLIRQPFTKPSSPFPPPLREERVLRSSNMVKKVSEENLS